MDRNNRAAGLSITRILCLALMGGLVALLASLPACNVQVSPTRRALQQVRPASNTALLMRNASYLKKIGRTELAVEELEDAHAQEPDNLEILDALIQCYEQLGHFDRAQELYEEGLSRSGHHPALENNRCYSLYLQGRLSQAESCFRNVLARQPDNQAARNNLGLVLCRQGKEAEALALWREALSEGEARQRLSQALASLGKDVPPGLAGSPLVPAAPRVAASTGTAAVSAPSASPVSPPAAIAATPVAAPAPQAANPSLSPAVPAVTASTTRQAPPAKPLHSPPPAAAATRPTKTSAEVLSVSDLLGTRIEIKNGNGRHDDARLTRTRLALEGFNVVSIGNHLDFGLEDTIIAYRPESFRVAKTLAAKYFPGAKLQVDDTLSPLADIRISLGRDRLGGPNMARGPEEGQWARESAPPSVPDARIIRAQEKDSPGLGHQKPSALPAATPDFLTARELSQVFIDLRNGNGVPGQARETRELLAAEGFLMVSIGNHVDFGIEKTLIAYRPAAARVAQVLAKKFFPEAMLQEQATLPTWMDVQVLLGRDLIPGHRHMAQSPPEETQP